MPLAIYVSLKVEGVHVIFLIWKSAFFHNSGTLKTLIHLEKLYWIVSTV